jgi:hypothetical protein
MLASNMTQIAVSILIILGVAGFLHLRKMLCDIRGLIISNVTSTTSSIQPDISPTSLSITGLCNQAFDIMKTHDESSDESGLVIHQLICTLSIKIKDTFEARYHTAIKLIHMIAVVMAMSEDYRLRYRGIDGSITDHDRFVIRCIQYNTSVTHCWHSGVDIIDIDAFCNIFNETVDDMDPMIRHLACKGINELCICRYRFNMLPLLQRVD